jgi:hypothetical protein
MYFLCYKLFSDQMNERRDRISTFDISSKLDDSLSVRGKIFSAIGFLRSPVLILRPDLLMLTNK